MSSLLDITLLTLRVGIVSTLLILVPSVALGHLLARGRFRGRVVLDTLVTLPMVLPPVAVGLLLLLLFARTAPLGAFIEKTFGAPIVLTWWAAAIASAVMSFPLLVLGAKQGFLGVPRRLEQVAATLGAGRARVFFRVTLPLAARGILHGTVFAFARGLGEFGATTVVAGHVPGETETLALAIEARIEAFDDRGALWFALVSIALAFLITFCAQRFLRERTE